MDNLKVRLIELLSQKAFIYSETPIFRLSSGKLSNYYINCKPVTMSPEGLYIVGNILFSIVENWDITAAGGLTLGADPLAYALSYTSFIKGKPIKTFVVRKEPKEHGTKSWIEGDVTEGEKVAILEDVITTGNSTFKAIKAALYHKLKIEGVIALVNREEGGKERIEKEGFKVISVVNKNELFTYWKNMKRD